MRKNEADRSIRSKAALTVFLVYFLAMPKTSWANAGTPLMWAGGLHLIFGNTFIGVFEGLVIGFVFRLPKFKAMGLMILANYFSTWVGGYWLIGFVVEGAQIDLYNAWPFFWKMVVVAYLVTLVLEFPFVALCFWKKNRWFGKSVLALLLAQTISYALLFGGYYAISTTTFYTETQLVELSDMKLPKEVSLYYISAEDGDVYLQHLGQQDDVKVFELDSRSDNERLLVRQSSDDENLWDLVAPIIWPGATEPEFFSVRKSFAGEAAPSYQSIQENQAYRIDSMFNYGPVPKLAGAKESLWEFKTGFWPFEGLLGTKKGDEKRLHIAFETPFGEWYIRNATHLPDDTVVFQLGEDQICVFHPETKKLALVARGRGPVAVIEETPSSSTEENNEPEPTVP